VTFIVTGVKITSDTEALAIYDLPVAAVGSGLDFYQLLKRRLFAVALIDLGLPDLDGFDLVAYLRQNTSIKIIIITSRDDLDARVKGYQSGADLHLTKPVKIPELAAAIVSLAGRRRPDDTGPQTWRLDRIIWRLFSPQGCEFRLGQQSINWKN
jgi:DNA-binding response OmpR family regulator